MDFGIWTDQYRFRIEATSQLSQHALATEFHLPLNYHMVATNADRELDLLNKGTDPVW